MKLPRDVSGAELIKALRVLEYSISRQRGSHIRITTQKQGEHHEVVPNHDPIKPGHSPVSLKALRLTMV